MAFKKPRINKVKSTMESLQIYLRAERKFGKTTLFRDIILEKFGSPEYGMLVKIGNEDGTSLLDELNETDVQTFQEFIELINWLISEKNKEHNIKMIGIDVVDELIPLVEDYVVKLSRKETGKPCKTILEAYGGFYRGKQKAAEILKSIFTKLKKSGIGVIAIAHTKTKKITPKGTIEVDGGYDVFTSTLENIYEAVFGDIFDVVLTGYIDREIVDGKMQSSTRYLCFRGDGFIEAGGRFAFGSVPDKIAFDKPNMAKDVITIIEDGMKNSRTNKITDEQFRKEQEEERKKLSALNGTHSTETVETVETVEEKVEPKQEKVQETIEEESIVEEEEESNELFGMGLEEEDEVDVEKNKQLLKEIQSKFKTCTKQQKEKIKELLKENNANKFNVEVLPTKVFEETLDILK